MVNLSLATNGMQRINALESGLRRANKMLSGTMLVLGIIALVALIALGMAASSSSDSDGAQPATTTAPSGKTAIVFGKRERKRSSERVCRWTYCLRVSHESVNACTRQRSIEKRRDRQGT